MKQFYTTLTTPDESISIFHLAFIDLATFRMKFVPSEELDIALFNGSTTPHGSVETRLEYAMSQGADLEDIIDILEETSTKDAVLTVYNNEIFKNVLEINLDDFIIHDTSQELLLDPVSVRDIMYLTAEQFLRRFIYALEEHNAEFAFKSAFNGAVRSQQTRLDKAPEFAEDDSLVLSDQALVEFYPVKLAVLANMLRASRNENQGVIRIDVFGEHDDTQPATVLVARFDENGIVE